MKREFTKLQLFRPRVMGERWRDLQNTFNAIFRDILLEKLTDSQKKMFEVKNYHYSDPNGQENGKEEGLLEHLISETMSLMNSPSHEDWFYIEFNIHDLRKFTGISNIKVFEEEIQDIAQRWKKLVEIEIKSSTKDSAIIDFTLL
ncbi:MAG TPA: hypothetical protein VGE63_01080 [Candidatus Paceibacterota bacterium]